MMEVHPVFRHTFVAMGSTIELVLVEGRPAEAEEAFALAEQLAGEWERTFSRFRADSELSRLNASSGVPVPVSTLLYAAIDAAITAATRTGGLFDPTVLPSLTALGYDRTFREIPEDDGTAVNVSPSPGVSAIALDPERRTVKLPAGVQIDLGGIVKGLYADVLAGSLIGWPGGVVSAGGDLRAWGISPDGHRWSIGVEDPDSPDRDLATVLVTDCGVATSGTNRRSWRRAGRLVHHLIDPRTGRPAESPFRAVTAIAPTTTHAEIASLALFVGGQAAAERDGIRRLYSLAIAIDARSRIVELRGASELGAHERRYATI